MKTEIANYLKKTYPNLSETNIKLLVAQAVFESGNFTSNFFKNGNNLFGIKYIGQRFANGFITRESDNSKFAKYSSYIDSINDRMRIYYALYPELLRSDDVERIVDTWLFSYLGRNAASKTKNSYKGSLIKLAGLENEVQKKKVKRICGAVILIIILISLYR